MKERLALTMVAALWLAVPAQAQPAQEPDYRWAFEAAVGWDNSISGNIFSSGIGEVNGLATVIQERSYDDVFGTGVQWRFGAGYMLDPRQEVRGALTIQNVGADALEVGNLGGAPLFATFDDYTSVAIDAGYRYHFEQMEDRFTPYAGATIGLAFISEMNADIAAPAVNFALNDANFYDGTTAFAFGVEGGVLIKVQERVDLNVNLGFRYTGGLSDIDPLVGSGLEDINDDTARWTLPFMVGVRVKF
jgi:hypothetical protein